MLEMLLVVLAAILAATGIGAAREISTVENLTWDGMSRSQVKQSLRRMGFKAPCGATLAALMGDEAWVPVPLTGKKSFSSVPREGRARVGVAGETHQVVGGAAKKAMRTATSTRAAVVAKRARDRAATAAKVACRSERRPTRAHGKGVWAAQVRAELAARREASAARPRHLAGVPATAGRTFEESGWPVTVRRVCGAEGLLSLARGSSVSRWHDAADELEAAQRELATAASDFAKARARVTSASCSL